jgi:formylglycine-generating enzyme required for sulfatase activity
VCKDSTGWRIFTLRGWHPLSTLLDTPVCHVSFFEADAFARWTGCRLPNEAEWEHAANGRSICGNLLDIGRLHPAIASGDGLNQLFGDSWEWIASPYTGYPGYKPLPGALGEYNGKFMSGQDDSAWRVLRHASDSHTHNLSQFLSAGDALAIHGNTFGRLI